jgi:hypothetical protein
MQDNANSTHLYYQHNWRNLFQVHGERCSMKARPFSSEYGAKTISQVFQMGRLVGLKPVIRRHLFDKSVQAILQSISCLFVNHSFSLSFLEDIPAGCRRAAGMIV